jgi:Ran GTPase-activating protein (RanGAP) involved in mRNA processing and transport
LSKQQSSLLMAINFPRSTSFQKNDGVDGDHVLGYLESHPEVQELRCEQVVSDEHVQAMDRLVKNYHTAINLISLELPHNGLTAAAGKPLANILRAQHETLQKLDLSYNQITCAGFGDLLEALTMNCPPSRLVHLDLTETQLGGKGATAIATILRHNRSIETLCLGKNNLGTKGIKALAPELTTNSSLKVLDLSYNNIKSRGASILALALENATQSNLRILDVSCNKIGVPGLQAFAKFLVVDRTIEGFYAGCNNLGPVGAAYLANVLKHNYTLRDLRLADNQIGDAGASLLVEGLAGNDSRDADFERLDLSWNGIGLDGAISFAEALKENAKVEMVDLTGNQIDSRGAEAIADAISYNHSLRELTLTHNQIGNVGAMAFAMALGKLSCHLHKLNWQENPMTDEGTASLQRVPQLRRNQQYWLGQLLRDLARGTVTSVNFADRRIGDEEVLLLTGVLSEHNPLVRSMWLSGATLSSRSLVPLIERALPSPSNILRLYLKTYACGEDVATALSQALRRNMTLEVLSLTDCSIFQTGAAAIADGLCHNSTLRRLNLDRNRIGDNGMAVLSSALPHASLTSISTSHNGLTDKTMGLENLKTLEELHMNGNQISDRGALEFCRFLMGDDCCRLGWVSLRQNQVTRKGGETMKNFLPDNAVVEY